MTRITRTALAPFGLPAPFSVAATAFRTRVAMVLRLWAGRRQSRIALARLDAHLIRDIGLDAGACDAEARRPFWR